MRKLPDLSHLARPGALIPVRVTPRASRDAIQAPDAPDAPLRVQVTAPPVDGTANEAVRSLLARALGIPRTQLTLQRGETSRDKLFRVAEPR